MNDLSPGAAVEITGLVKQFGAQLKGQLSQAIKEYRKVLAENPNDANALNQVSVLRSNQ